jgi:hypothetical protein
MRRQTEKGILIWGEGAVRASHGSDRPESVDFVSLYEHVAALVRERRFAVRTLRRGAVNSRIRCSAQRNLRGWGEGGVEGSAPLLGGALGAGGADLVEVVAAVFVDGEELGEDFGGVVFLARDGVGGVGEFK